VHVVTFICINTLRCQTLRSVVIVDEFGDAYVVLVSYLLLAMIHNVLWFLVHFKDALLVLVARPQELNSLPRYIPWEDCVCVHACVHCVCVHVCV